MTTEAITPHHYHNAPHGIPGQPFDYFPYMDGVRATAFRYVWRAGFKWDTEEDLAKASACVTRDITHGENNLSDRPGHLTHALQGGPDTIRRRLLIDLWGRHDLNRTLGVLAYVTNNPHELDKEIL